MLQFKNRVVIGVVNEDAPEEPHHQETIEAQCAVILLRAYEGDEQYPHQFNRTDLHVLP